MLGSRFINKYTSSRYEYGSWPEPWGRECRGVSIRIFMNTLIRVADADRLEYLFFYFFLSSFPLFCPFSSSLRPSRTYVGGYLLIIFTPRQTHLTNHDWHSIYFNFTHNCRCALTILDKGIVHTGTVDVHPIFTCPIPFPPQNVGCIDGPRAHILLDKKSYYVNAPIDENTRPRVNVGRNCRALDFLHSHASGS